MQLTESKFFDMVATMAAGALANPTNGNVYNNTYEYQMVITNTIQSLQMAITQAGFGVVPDKEYQ